LRTIYYSIIRWLNNNILAVIIQLCINVIDIN